jgi:ABC-type multidrug transport system ATPase subunit
MDPVSRREVWDIIERAKKGRVVILTTHSMEEADTLADTIGTAFSPTIHRQQPNTNQHTHTQQQRCSYHGQGSAAVYGLGHPLEEEVRSRTSRSPPLPSVSLGI